MAVPKNYLQTLKERGKQSHVYRKHQLVGLTLADILHDREHKALYIKLAKQYGEHTLMALAKGVSERRNVKNDGAYFMKLVQMLPKPPKVATIKKQKKKENKQRTLFKWKKK